MMLSRMRVVVAGVISRTVVDDSGSRGHARLSVSVIERHDAGQLSDHEQADQKWNDSSKAPKPLHG
jgi:hypothetical protein